MLELQRNVIFGQFVETGSFIHRMDARIKIAATFVLIVASFLIDDFLGFAVVLPLLRHHRRRLQDTPRVRTAGLAVLPRVPGLHPRLPGTLLPGRRARIELPVAVGHTLGLHRGSLHGRASSRCASSSCTTSRPC